MPIHPQHPWIHAHMSQPTRRRRAACLRRRRVSIHIHSCIYICTVQSKTIDIQVMMNERKKQTSCQDHHHHEPSVRHRCKLRTSSLFCTVHISNTHPATPAEPPQSQTSLYPNLYPSLPQAPQHLKQTAQHSSMDGSIGHRGLSLAVSA